MRGFVGLDHYDQRTASGGNQFSTEPPDGAICAGAGREIEMVNSALAAYDRRGHMIAGPIGLNEFFGLKPSINRTTGEYGPFTGDIKCLFDPGTQRWFLTSSTSSRTPSTGDFTGRHGGRLGGQQDERPDRGLHGLYDRYDQRRRDCPGPPGLPLPG